MNRSERPSIVRVRLQGRLGNQMFQYAVGRALALRTQRTLELQTSRVGGADLEHFPLPVFNIQARLAPPARVVLYRLSRSARLPGVARRLAAAIVAARWSVLTDGEQGYDPGIFAAKGNLILEGYWQSERYFADIQATLRREFTFRDPPSAASAHWLEAIGDGESVGVHVRRGDYARHPGIAARHGTCDAFYYARAMGAMAERVDRPRFFVFSDDPGWAAANLRLPGPTEVVRGNQGNADWEDLRLMAACRHFVIANSTFSWWGAWLSRHAAKVVVAPARWFADPLVSSRDRIPDGWVAV